MELCTFKRDPVGAAIPTWNANLAKWNRAMAELISNGGQAGKRKLSFTIIPRRCENRERNELPSTTFIKR